MAMELATPVPLAIAAFGISAVASGIFFMGYDTEPAEKVGITLGLHQLFTGIILLLVSAIMLSHSYPEPTGMVNAWVATLLGFFGMVWALLGLSFLKGADFKMLSWLMLYTGIISVFYAYTSSMLKLTDFVVLLVLVAIGVFLAFLGLRGIPAVASKIAGFFFVLIGIDAIYILIKLLLPVLK